jgi:hypothetical protein
MKSLYELASNAGLETTKHTDEFARLIIEECIAAIETQYIPGDLSERTAGLRRAKTAIRKRFPRV